jgi:hypothetical protein
MNEILPKRDPDVLQRDPCRAHLLATAAERTAVDRVAEFLPLFKGRGPVPEDSPQEAASCKVDLLEFIQPVYTGEMSVLAGRNRGANVRAQATQSACLRLNEFFDAVVFSGQPLPLRHSCERVPHLWIL